MASSEIEIVPESSEQKKSSSPPPPPPQVVISDIYSASAYGDLSALRKFVEEEGASLSVPDENGFYALQWAALNNFAHIVQYIIEHGGDVNATDKAMQTALHWSAVRGSVASADVLLLNGTRVEAADVSGYRAAHVAAQYGQTAFLYFIMAKHHADHDAPDNEGRSPLHWAAYKGFVDTIRLLLFKDACSWRQDKEGCTPLHWAAIRGNMEACIILVHAGTKQELMVKDHVGFTPAEVASDKGHRHVALFLSNANRPNNKCWWGGKVCYWKVGDRGYAPILFCIVVINIILFLNSILYAPALTKVTAVVGLWGWIAVSAAIVALILLVRCSRKDPGYIKPSRGSDNSNDNEDPLLNIDLNNYSVWMGNWSQLCPTCKIVRPIRSKHCPACKHCVEQFDHHCPWISNCVGKRNKWDFCVFLFVGGLTAILGDAVAIQRVWTSMPVLRAEETWIHHVIVEHPGIVAFLFMDTMILMACLTLLSVQASQIARNVTTNELANSMRYGYLRGPDGRFRNPYDHGCQKNCVDFLVHGYTNDEISWPPLERLHDNRLDL